MIQVFVAKKYPLSLSSYSGQNKRVINTHELQNFAINGGALVKELEQNRCLTFKIRVIDALQFYDKMQIPNKDVFCEIIFRKANPEMFDQIKENDMIRIFNV